MRTALADPELMATTVLEAISRMVAVVMVIKVSLETVASPRINLRLFRSAVLKTTVIVVPSGEVVVHAAVRV